MADTQLGPVLHQLRRLAFTGGRRDLSDPQLLQRFLAGRDQAAFAALVQRHAGLVWGVCRNVLRHEQDTEDAFQATFLVLACQAGSVRRAEALAGWLHGVAYRVAMTAKRKAAVRRSHERQASPMTFEQAPSEAALRDLGRVLDEEIQRLADKYRAPFVLCCLEGKSKPEAAQELGWKEATLSWRLAQARKQLQTRLRRRGVTLSAALGAVALAERIGPRGLALQIEGAVRAAVPASTGPAGEAVSAGVARLADAVSRALRLARMKHGLALLLGLSVAVAGACLVVRQILSAGQTKTPTVARGTTGQHDEAKSARTDSHGDPLPPCCVGRLGTVRFRHDGWLHAVVSSPDGRTLATAAGKTISLWGATTGKLRRRWDGRAFDVQSLAYSPDGRTLASGGGDHVIRLWEPGTGKERRKLLGHHGDPKQPFLHEAGVYALVFGRNGRRLVSLGTDKTIRSWDMNTGKEIRQFQGFAGTPHTISLSPDGTTLAAAIDVAEGRGEVWMWEEASGRRLRRLEQGGDVRSIAFEPGGKFLATAGGKLKEPGEFRLWDLVTGKVVRSWQGHEGWVFALAFTPDGRRLVSGGYDNTIRLWDVATGKELRRLARHQSPVYSLVLERDGRTLVYRVADNTVHFRNVLSGQELRRFGGPEHSVTGIAFAPDSKYLAAGGGDAELVLWDVAARQEVRRLRGHQGKVSAVSFGPGGKLLASGGHDGTIRLWEASSGHEVRAIQSPRGWVTHLAMSPDGRKLASFGEDQVVHLWEAATGKEVRQLHSVRGFLHGLAFSPSGKLLATASGIDVFVRLWDADSGEETSALKHEGGMNGVAFSADGKTLAAACMDRTVSLWETATGRKRLWLRPGTNVTSVAFSPDGRLLATANAGNSRTRDKDGKLVDGGNEDRERVRLWDLATGKELPPFAGHRGGVTALTFASDGKTLASGSSDTTVLLWDATRLQRKERPRPLAAAELQKVWADLAGVDAAAAYRAIGELAAASRQAVALLGERLRPVVATDAKLVAPLLAQLDSPRFAERRQALKGLERLGEAAEPALREALAGNVSVEVRQRIERLLRKLETMPRLRTSRALEVLERIGLPVARPLLERLARGARGAWLTRQAEAALRRLDKLTGEKR
jgi:RNA polymerase sigma factor (sigma-70 family)